MISYLGLGSNMGDRIGAIQQAMGLLTDHPKIRLLSASSFYETEPVGDTNQDWFINVAVAVDTILSPEELLMTCLDVEKRMGRLHDPNRPLGPRIIDIDVLFYENQILSTENVTIPHPGAHERAFVLVPLLEINPRLVHPVLNMTVEQLHEQLASPEEVVLYGTRGATFS